MPDGEPPYVISRARIATVSEPVIPAGYSIRPVTRVKEAAALAELHASAFPGARWTVELYRHVMESPGYDPGRELVAGTSRREVCRPSHGRRWDGVRHRCELCIERRFGGAVPQRRLRALARARQLCETIG